ncbi:secreted antigen 1 [Babesia divergens]|uniref:Secreted antigen 1 n=1 Tax=Babesia divergens TaxID=32595 RepID=A0AAD9LGC3_BABDI|nr:secreted antigen 1 [Babesia divergens]
MSAEECSGIQFKHGSLKEILEELHKLKDSGFKQSVFNHLKSGLGTYCGDTYLNAFYKNEGGGYSGGTIQAVTYAGYDICRQLVKTPPGDGRSVNIHAKHDDCIKKYADALKKCLPGLYSALYYLYFMCSTECSGIGGGHWSSYSVKGSDSDSGNSLYKWLTDQDGSGLIKRGFSHGELHDSNTGKNVAEKLKSAVSLTLGQYDGSLQNVLCGFMFVCTWDDALTGHACLFLDKFCKKVMEDVGGTKFKQKFTEACPGGNFKKLQAICRELQTHLQPFTDSYGDSGLRAICKENQELFEEIWKEDSFGEYCKWLKVNLDDIIKALNEMSSNSSPWSADSLRVASSAGTFKYGFVFTRKWDGESESLRDKVKGYISALINGDKGSLEDLKKCLNGDSSANSEAITQAPTGTSGATAAGAAGGIFGLGGAGAGAAYATNAFGFQNFISGLISSFLK